MFGSVKKYHFIGIGGIGMSGLAEILLGQGCIVSGSDRALNQQTERLQKLGATIVEGHSVDAIGDADVVVYTAAIPETNPELKAAKENNIITIKRSELLAEMLRMRKGICIAGVHGKTTTTSMTGLVLEKAGIDPTILVGGNLNEFNGSNAKAGNSDIVVAEADEYDRTFLKLMPYVAVITSIELEHVDIYKDLDDIKQAFIEFANKTPFYNKVILCADDAGAKSIIPELKRLVYTYGLSEDATLQARDVKQQNLQSSFSVYENDKKLGSIDMQVPGSYNIQNALAAIAVARGLGVSFETCKAALELFRGVQRRFEIKYDKEVLLLDDYAHHPGETSSLINALKTSTDRRVVAVFQPHLYSRTKDFYAAFAKSFLPVDVLICTDIYPAREEPIAGVSGKLITDELVKFNHKNTLYIEDKTKVAEHLMDIHRDGDVIVTIGAGDIWKQGERFIEMKKNAQVLQ